MTDRMRVSLPDTVVEIAGHPLSYHISSLLCLRECLVCVDVGDIRELLSFHWQVVNYPLSHRKILSLLLSCRSWANSGILGCGLTKTLTTRKPFRCRHLTVLRKREEPRLADYITRVSESMAAKHSRLLKDNITS